MLSLGVKVGKTTGCCAKVEAEPDVAINRT
jgi:hypothetical protein